MWSSTATTTAAAFVVITVCGRYPMLIVKAISYIFKYVPTSSVGTGVGQECHR